MQDLPILELKKRLKNSLPGPNAHLKMSHPFRQNKLSPPDHARLAGVLSLFYPKNGEWHIVLIERVSHHANDRHRGQISFPGGKFEPQDASLKHTALRETEEEVGVPANRIEIIGQMTELYIPVSNFLVHPFIGKIDETPTFKPQLSEVAGILEVPFAQLKDPKTLQETSMSISPEVTLNNVPYFNINGKVVWGATAMMLSELLELVPYPS